MRFAANLHFLFTEVAFLDRFAAARAAGFDAVEFPNPYAYPLGDLRARLEAQRLRCVLINFPMGDAARGEKGLACLPERKADFEASVEAALAAARALDCPRANCMAGVVPPGRTAEALHPTLVANLRLAARAFAAAGLTVTLEALNRHDVPGYCVATVAEAEALIAEVGAPNLRFQFDLYHLQRMELDLVAALVRALPLIEHVQIADVPGRTEPGSGTSPLLAALDQLAAARYAGHVAGEYHPTRRTEETLGWLAEYTARYAGA